jgi:hypothetical protein
MNYDNYKKFEDFILTSFGIFSQSVTGVTKLFLLDQDWPSTTTDTLGIQILSIDDDGWGFDNGYDVDNNFQNTVGFRVVLELIALRERKDSTTSEVTATPMSTLWQLNHSLKGNKDSKYKHLYSKGIGFLECTNPTRVDTVLDGVRKERRARMTVFLHCLVKDLDSVVVPPIETVFINASIIPNLGSEDFINTNIETSIT